MTVVHPLLPKFTDQPRNTPDTLPYVVFHTQTGRTSVKYSSLMDVEWIKSIDDQPETLIFTCGQKMVTVTGWNLHALETKLMKETNMEVTLSGTHPPADPDQPVICSIAAQRWL